jgi:hypothetical protein
MRRRASRVGRDRHDGIHPRPSVVVCRAEGRSWAADAASSNRQHAIPADQGTRARPDKEPARVVVDRIEDVQDVATRRRDPGGATAGPGIGTINARDGIVFVDREYGGDDDGWHDDRRVQQRRTRREEGVGRPVIPIVLPGAYGILGSYRPTAATDKDTHTGVLQRIEAILTTIVGVLPGRRRRSPDHIGVPACVGGCESSILVRQPPLLPRARGRGAVPPGAFLLRGGDGGDSEEGGGEFDRPVALREAVQGLAVGDIYIYIYISVLAGKMALLVVLFVGLWSTGTPRK